MSDLSNLLGDVYSSIDNPDLPAAPREPTAANRVPERQPPGDDQPSPPPAPRYDDLAAALSAPAVAPPPPPVPRPPAPAQMTPPAPPAPAPTPKPAEHAWAAPVPPAAPVVWQPSDDDIFPIAKGVNSAKKKRGKG